MFLHHYIYASFRKIDVEKIGGIFEMKSKFLKMVFIEGVNDNFYETIIYLKLTTTVFAKPYLILR